MPRPSAFLVAAASAALLGCCLLSGGCAAARDGDGPRGRISAPDLSAERRSRAADIVAASAGALLELRRSARCKALDSALTDARAVIIVPGLYRAGFLYSLRGGTGVLVARRPNGGWSSPVLMTFCGVGFGYQVGVERERMVFVIAEDAVLRRILDCGLSLDAGAGFDILGVRAGTDTSTLTERRPVLVFSDGVGLMAGAAFHGGALRIDPGLTAAYHGPGYGGVAALLRGADAPDMATFRLWGALVRDLPASDP